MGSVGPVTRYVPGDLPDWPPEPWHFPGILWRLPYWPVRLYLHAGDRLLFRLWELSRPLMWRLEDAMGSTYSSDGLVGPGSSGAASPTIPDDPYLPGVLVSDTDWAERLGIEPEDDPRVCSIEHPERGA